MINALIVENEIKSVHHLQSLISRYFPEIDIMATAATVAEAANKIKTLLPQLVFLDVELDMPFTGFDLLAQTKDYSYGVIFITGFNKYAAKAFRFSAIDFIEKPYGEEELKEAIIKFKKLSSSNADKRKNILLHNVTQTSPSLFKVGIPVLGGYDFVTLSDIIYCRADDNCTNFYLTNKQKITATKTLKWVDELLNEHYFFRIHDSYLINVQHIKKYKKGGEGGVVELTDRYEADVSRRRKDDFLKLLSDLKMIYKPPSSKGEHENL